MTQNVDGLALNSFFEGFFFMKTCTELTLNHLTIFFFGTDHLAIFKCIFLYTKRKLFVILK